VDWHLLYLLDYDSFFFIKRSEKGFFVPKYVGVGNLNCVL